MRKIYSLVLIAAGLLIGTNAWAVDVSTWDDLQTAIATPNATINLTEHITMPNTGGTFDFNGATITCNKYYLGIDAANEYTIQNVTLSGYTGGLGAIYLKKAGAVVNLESTVKFTNNGQKYEVYVEAQAAATINNRTNVARINVNANSTINNDGNITVGVNVLYSQYITVNCTVNNGAGASYKHEFATAANLTLNNDPNASVIINNFSGGQLSGDNLTVNKGTFSQLSGDNLTVNKGTFSQLSGDNITINGGTFSQLSGDNITINGGTFSQLSGSNVTIHGGTFNEAPTATGTIEPAFAVDCKFVNGVGSLEVADGYTWRSFDRLIVRNDAGQVEVTHANSSTETRIIEEAFANAENGDTITLLEDVRAFSTLWLGTANKEDAKKSLTLDLNGHTLSSEINVNNTIWLTHGALYIINSVPGQGGIVNNYTAGTGQVVFIYGSPDRNAINSRNAAVEDLFVYLLIDEGVTLSATDSEGNGFTVDAFAAGKGINYGTNVYSCVSPAYGVANGVRVDVKGTIDTPKYGGKVNGTVRHPKEMIVNYSCVTDVQEGDTINSTFIHVYPTAVMHASANLNAAAVYSSGYGRWLIEGVCQGATGLYAKSGVVDITNATIESTYTDEATITTGGTSGVKAGGNAIVIESNNYYTGQQALVIGGDTKVSTEAENGAAIVDVVDDTHDSKVDNIVINGGSFSGENGIVISSETASEQNTTINGVTVVGEITVGGSSDPADVADIMGNNTHVTEVENPDGSKTVIVSTGSAPKTQEGDDPTPWSWCADNAQSGKSVAWTKIENAEITSGTVTLDELQINSGSLLDGNQQLTIHDGATLQVERLIMNGYARIIVEAGGKLIVTGTQGISAPSINNILLKNEENKPAVFIFHPNVNSNKHPNGTVEFTSKGYNNGGSDYAWQKFGVPTQTGELSEISIEGDVATAFGRFNYAAATPAWEVIGYLNHDPALDLNDLNQSFEYYQMLHNTTTVGTKVTFKGKLVGNDCPAPVIRPNFWNGYANSYSAPIDGAALLAQIPAPADKAFYLYEMDNLTNQFSWVAQSNLHLSNIQPMQPFLLRNPSADDAALALNYAAAVYTPATTPNNAPARRVADDMTKVEFIVRGEAGVDHVIVAQDDEFSDAFDNGYDVTKYMNDDVNMYVTADEKMAIYATDNLENTYVGLSTVKGGNYTITFANVQGEELTLIDHETGAQVAMVDGNTYEFTAAANATNDYRFEVVGAAKMPTAIENAEAVKSVKGIYTITGQYLGEMSVWNSLPAGVYVVNGEKRVK